MLVFFTKIFHICELLPNVSYFVVFLSFELFFFPLYFSSPSSWAVWQDMLRPSHPHSINQELQRRCCTYKRVKKKRKRRRPSLCCAPRGRLLPPLPSRELKHMLVWSFFWRPQAQSGAPNAEVSVSMAAPQSTLERSRTCIQGKQQNNFWHHIILRWKNTTGYANGMCDVGRLKNKQCKMYPMNLLNPCS